MRRPSSYAALAALGLALSLPAFAGDAPAKLPKGLSIGDTVPGFDLKDLDGKPFSLDTARKITHEQALDAVREAAKGFGGADVKPEDPIEKLTGLVKDGAVDRAQRAAFVQAAGKPFGLIATAESTQAVKTVGDVVAWVEKAATAPMVFMCWSSGCPTSQIYEERINDLFSRTGARLYVLGCNYNDEPDAMRGRLEGDSLGWRVLLDRDAKVTDVLGGRRTPHVFLLDGKNALRYAGSIDNDAAATEAPEKRTNWLLDAISAVAEERGVDVLMTAPKG